MLMFPIRCVALAGVLLGWAGCSANQVLLPPEQPGFPPACAERESGPPAEVAGPAPPPPTCQPEPLLLPRPSIEDRLNTFALHVWHDYQNYYSGPNLCDLGLGIGVAAVFAETPLDQHFRDWYQDDVRTPGTDNVARFFKNFGEATYVVPSIVGLTVAGELLDEDPTAAVVGQYGERVSRAYLVGAPPMLFLQAALGSSRPGWEPYGSQWHPFVGDNAASGHAFVSSVLFLTAADMVGDPLLKGALCVGSTVTGWSRINDDAHYLSQVILGWWLGYLAVRTVDHTELEAQLFRLTPLVTPEMTGVGFTQRW
jgi:hypothetical protein